MPSHQLPKMQHCYEDKNTEECKDDAQRDLHEDEALRSSSDFDAPSPAGISPNATPSGGTASRGADKVERIGKQHRQQKTTILFMFCFSRVERVETCRTFENSDGFKNWLRYHFALAPRRETAIIASYYVFFIWGHRPQAPKAVAANFMRLNGAKQRAQR